jgi:uncharacterized protein
VPDEDAPRFRIGDAVLATLGAIVLGALGGGLIVGLAGYDTFDEAPIEILVVAQVPLWIGLAAIPWLVSRRRGTGDLRRDYGLAMRWRDVPVGLAAGFVTQIAVVVFLPLYDLVGVDPDRVNESAQELGDKATDPLGVVLLVVMTLLGAAVFEELFYRGLWLRSLERRIPAPAAIAVTALVFAVVHFQPLAIPPLAVFGAVAGALAHRSGRLGPAIWAHVGFNALAVIGLVAGS